MEPSIKILIVALFISFLPLQADVVPVVMTGTGQQTIANSPSTPPAIAFWGGIDTSKTFTSGSIAGTTITSGTGLQLSTVYDVNLAVPVTFNSTIGATSTCLIEISPDNVTYPTLGTETIPVGVAFAGTVRVITIPNVRKGYYVRLTVTNATIGTGKVW